MFSKYKTTIFNMLLKKTQKTKNISHPIPFVTTVLRKYGSSVNNAGYF